MERLACINLSSRRSQPRGISTAPSNHDHGGDFPWWSRASRNCGRTSSVPSGIASTVASLVAHWSSGAVHGNRACGERRTRFRSYGGEAVWPSYQGRQFQSSLYSSSRNDSVPVTCSLPPKDSRETTTVIPVSGTIPNGSRNSSSVTRFTEIWKRGRNSSVVARLPESRHTA